MPSNQDVPEATKTCKQGHDYVPGNGCPECSRIKMKEITKRRYWANREKMCAERRKRSKENRDYENAQMRKWREKNREHLKAYQRKWQEEHYEERRRKFKQWYTDNRIFNLWRGMVRRCTNEKCVPYRNYGALGIKVCERWLGADGYKNFESDMGPCPSLQHTIERNDVKGDYCPENCRWATRMEQTANRRNSVVVEYQGKKYCLTQLARQFGISPQTVATRMRFYGWPLERALTEKKGRHRRADTESTS